MNTLKRLLIDGNNLAHRMRHVHEALSSDSGRPTGVLHGTIQSIRALLEEWNPDICVFAMDSEAQRSWRYDIFPAYKSTRIEKRAKESREEKKAYAQFQSIQVPDTVRALQRLGVIVLQHPRMEADDIIAMLRYAKYTTSPAVDDIVVSTDKDFIQLVRHDCRVLNPTNGAMYYLHGSPAILCNRKDTPIAPCPMSYLAQRIVCGDKSDAIPGITGIGEITAMRLFNKAWLTGNLMKGIRSCADASEIEGNARERKFVEAVRNSITCTNVILRNAYLMALIEPARRELGVDVCFDAEAQAVRKEYRTQLKAFHAGEGIYGRWLRPPTLAAMPNEFTIFFGKRSFQFVNGRRMMAEVLQPFRQLQTGAAAFVRTCKKKKTVR